jgi:hypothetical protein
VTAIVSAFFCEKFLLLEHQLPSFLLRRGSAGELSGGRQLRTRGRTQLWPGSDNPTSSAR